MSRTILICYVHWIATGLLIQVNCSTDAERLYGYLMRDYNKLVRPVADNRDSLTMRLSLKFLQLIGVDEVNQVITSSVVARQAWRDYKLVWQPEEFGGIVSMDIPGEAIWLPDLVLYNNADGNYHITRLTKVRLNYTGDIVWEPPAIYKSYCAIDVRYFPYDKQSCTMKFGSWTYDQTQVDLIPERGYEEDRKSIHIGMDLSEYKQSIEWDILEASAMRNKTVFSYGSYVDIVYKLVIRRKTLFYTVNLIIPCVLISFLTVFVFYLPTDSGEKVTLCISILVSLTVFVLLLAKIIPPTSLTVPLIGRYLLFTLIMVTCSIAMTIVVINVHFRSPATHRMSNFTRAVFIQILPKLLLIERPQPLYGDSPSTSNAAIRNKIKIPNDLASWNPRSLRYTSPRKPSVTKLTPDAEAVVDGINFVADHLDDTKEFANVSKDWRYIATVLDRLFLWIFAAACLIGTGKIVLDAPPLYEMEDPIPRRCDLPANFGLDPWICYMPDEDDAMLLL